MHFTVDADAVQLKREQMIARDDLVTSRESGSRLAIHRTRGRVLLSAETRSGTAAVDSTLRYSEPEAGTHCACLAAIAAS